MEKNIFGLLVLCLTIFYNTQTMDNVFFISTVENILPNDIKKQILICYIDFNQLTQAKTLGALSRLIKPVNALTQLNKQAFSTFKTILLTNPLKKIFNSNDTALKATELEFSFKELFLQQKRKIFFDNIKTTLNSNPHISQTKINAIQTNNLTLKDAKIVGNKLLEAYWHNQDIIASLFENTYADINHQFSENCVTEMQGKTALIGSCSMRNLELVKFYLNRQANPNTPDKDGNTALMHAIINNNSNAIKLLVQHGAKVDIKNNKGETPLSKASKSQKKLLVYKK